MPQAIPKHLKKYTVKQDYSRYTPEDQAVWRYVMRRLKHHLATYAHEVYLQGLKKTGLDSEHIPKVSVMDRKLRRFGWGAVPVSGFIPPAAFMEFQALGYLPIATEIRTADHVEYTPAPDIVHEAAGHAPIIVDKEYAAYLKQYAEIAAKSIISKDDMDLYEAIRLLSDAKEDPASTEEEIEALEKDLAEKAAAIKDISEAGLLSRMNWWTAEYGLIGDLQNPRIFGAGLLSSPGEAQTCLETKVEKIPLTVDCVKYSYDITERQPQLFVTPSFKHLGKVLTDLQKEMAFEVGGTHGLSRAIKAKTVNTVQMDTGLQISGQVERYETHEGEICFFKLAGPTQLSINGNQLKGHGTKYHAHGYSSPIGQIKNFSEDLVTCPHQQLAKLGFKKGLKVNLTFGSGFKLDGTFKSCLRIKNKNVLMTFTNCTVTYDGQIYFAPEWGTFDLALGQQIVSVFGGPADRKNFETKMDFVAKIIPARKKTPQTVRLHRLFEQVAQLRKKRKRSKGHHQKISALWSKFEAEFFDNWLLGLEIIELMVLSKYPEAEFKSAMNQLKTSPMSGRARLSLNKGLALIGAD